MRSIWILTLWLVAPGWARADAATPPDSVPDDRTYTLAIRAERGRAMIRFRAAGLEHATSFDPYELLRVGEEVRISNEISFTPGQLKVAGRQFPLAGLVVEELYKDTSGIHVLLRGPVADTTAGGAPTVRGRTQVGEALRVDDGDFVRGDAICFGGDVRVYGEVNHDVVVVGGNVCVATDGVIGGDVAVIGGRVRVLGRGRVRGDILTSGGHLISRHHRLHFDDGGGEGGLQGTAHYNRVDGLYLEGGTRAADPDSILPSFCARAGYAFEAERWRYSIGARQRIGDRWAVALGGGFLRRTATDDDWLSPTDETSAAALLIREDMRDYYEEEGGVGYLTMYPGGAGELGAAYSFLQLDWMDSRPRLWSLFGGKKQFRENFSSVPLAERLARRSEFEGSLGELCAWYAIDTRDDTTHPRRGWWGRLEYRQAGGDLRGDLEYKRFTAELRRFQPLGRRLGLNTRVKYGTSDGELPLLRTFYLGGLRTVRGIDHKSLHGEQMLLGNFEYVLETGLLDARTAVFLDAGRTVPRRERLFDGSEFASAVGLRLILDELQLEVAKSLNDADEPVRWWAMLTRTF
jgi:hypothetical protein